MSASLIVLQSFPAARSTTNPYLIQLGRGLEELPGVSVLTFSWRRAITGKYDVFHAHWPEILVSGHSPLKKLVRQMLTLVLLGRLALTRTAIVRTVHNVGLPDGISGRERLLLRLFDRMTTFYIRLNNETPLPTDRPSATIPHGHYRDWFSGFSRPERVPGRIGYVGLIRRYKGVEDLVKVFRATAETHPDLSLQLGGNPSTPELGEHIAALAAGDNRISFHLEHISDAELAETICSSELVVLPYRFMHNSGGALTALSLDRPVLVPANPVNNALSGEVGPGWVFQYSGKLTPAAITDTLAAIDGQGPRPRPDLSAREWHVSSVAHREAYDQARGLVPARAERHQSAGTR